MLESSLMREYYYHDLEKLIRFIKPSIVWKNQVGFMDDIQSELEKLRKKSSTDDRLLITYYNHLWEPVLNLASVLGWRERTIEQNWLNDEDLKNICNLAGWDVVTSQKRMLMPLNLGIISEVINKWLAGQKASLIMERMMGGLIYTPQDARTLGKRLRQMYGLLDPQKGVMFVQVPRKIYKPAGVRETDFERATLQDPAVYRDYLGRWVKMIHSDHQGVLDVQWDGAAALRLVRNPGAPAELPVIEFK